MIAYLTRRIGSPRSKASTGGSPSRAPSSAWFLLALARRLFRSMSGSTVNGGRRARCALWGGAERVQISPLDEPIICSQTAGYAGRLTNRYFAEILKPRGLI